MDWFLKIDGGLGRSIASTGAVEKYVERKNSEGDRVFVITGYPFVFDNIDGIERVLNFNHATLYEDYISKGEYVEVEPYNYSGHFRDLKHVSCAWNYLLNGDDGFLEPKLVLTDNELEAGKKWVENVKKKDGKKVLLMQPFGMAGGYVQGCESVCKEAKPVFDESYRSLVMDNINGLVTKLSEDYTIFVVKDQRQVEVKDTFSLTENPRLLFAISLFVDGVIACDSMLQHVCKAVKTKCPVVVFWGGTNPKQFGYEDFLNLEKDFNRVVEPNRLPHDHSYYLRKNKDCNVFSEEFEEKAVDYLRGKS